MDELPEKPPAPPEPSAVAEVEKALETELEGEVEPDKIQRAAVRVVEMQYSAPLPHPEHLRQYENTLPGAADRIFSMTEHNLEHSRDMDKVYFEYNKRGLNYGFILFATLIVFGFASFLATGNLFVPLCFLGPATIMGGVTAFVRSRSN
ncbi:MAG: DUF2335 domain-containing protein [Pseudomonadales bacterium]